ncbi:Kinase-like protein [Mycena kentingensis (nom. inval.)]|nr:Kinase-like protein [Mycena kentingensis (nom. inval.)]
MDSFTTLTTTTSSDADVVVVRSPLPTNGDSSSGSSGSCIVCNSDPAYNDAPLPAKHKPSLPSPNKMLFIQNKLASFKAVVSCKKSIDRQPSTDDYDQEVTIGQGASCTVTGLRHKRTGQRVAVKMCPMSSPSVVRALVTEHDIFRLFNRLPDCPATVLQAQMIWAEKDRMFVMTPEYPSDLYTFNKRMEFSSGRVKLLMAQLVSGLHTLHFNRVIHRDVKSANILLTHEHNAVVSDFGLSKVFRSSATSMRGSARSAPKTVSFDADPEASTGSFLLPPSDDELNCVANEFCGTIGYMAPEVYRGQSYSFNADVFSLGVVMHELTTGRMPHHQLQTGRYDQQLYRAYETQSLNPQGWDPLAFNLVSKMMDPNPATRLSIDEVKAHPYFENADWKAIARHQIPAAWMHEFPGLPAAAPKKTFMGRLFGTKASPLPVSVAKDQIVVPVAPVSPAPTLVASSCPTLVSVAPTCTPSAAPADLLQPANLTQRQLSGATLVNVEPTTTTNPKLTAAAAGTSAPTSSPAPPKTPAFTKNAQIFAIDIAAQFAVAASGDGNEKNMLFCGAVVVAGEVVVVLEEEAVDPRESTGERRPLTRMQCSHARGWTNLTSRGVEVRRSGGAATAAAWPNNLPAGLALAQL